MVAEVVAFVAGSPSGSRKRFDWCGFVFPTPYTFDLAKKKLGGVFFSQLISFQDHRVLVGFVLADLEPN